MTWRHLPCFLLRSASPGELVGRGKQRRERTLRDRQAGWSLRPHLVLPYRGYPRITAPITSSSLLLWRAKAGRCLCPETKWHKWGRSDLRLFWRWWWAYLSSAGSPFSLLTVSKHSAKRNAWFLMHFLTSFSGSATATVAWTRLFIRFLIETSGRPLRRLYSRLVNEHKLWLNVLKVCTVLIQIFHCPVTSTLKGLSLRISLLSTNWITHEPFLEEQQARTRWVQDIWRMGSQMKFPYYKQCEQCFKSHLYKLMGCTGLNESICSLLKVFFFLFLIQMFHNKQM